MITTNRLVHFSIPVSDLERGKQFYSEVLGMKTVATPPRMVFLRFGSDTMILCQKPEMIPKDLDKEGLVHHAFSVTPKEWDLAKMKMSEAGISITGEEDRKGGVFVGRSLYFKDPDGNALELFDGTI